MRKFQNASETEDLLDELLEGIDLANQEEVDEEEEKVEEEVDQKKKKPDKFDTENLPNVIERLEAGLIGSLKVLRDKTNRPIIKNRDIVQLRKPNRLLIKDFVFYRIEEDYFLRRIIKFKEDDIYVAGDNEREYHIIHKQDILGKVVGRERGNHYFSFSFNPKNKFYTFRKVNMAFFRLGNRVRTYEQEQNQEILEKALQNQEAMLEAKQPEIPTIIANDIDLESDLKAFLDPDELVKELRYESKAQAKAEEEEIVYVDEYGNEIKDYKPEEEKTDKGKFMKSDENDEEESSDDEAIDEENLENDDLDAASEEETTE